MRAAYMTQLTMQHALELCRAHIVVDELARSLPLVVADERDAGLCRFSRAHAPKLQHNEPHGVGVLTSE